MILKEKINRIKFEMIQFIYMYLFIDLILWGGAVSSCL